MGKPVESLFAEKENEAGNEHNETDEWPQHDKWSKTRYYVKKDGTHFWANDIVFPLYDDNAKLMGFSHLVQDLSIAKKAEQILTEAKDYAQSIVDTAREPLIVLHSDLTINSANRAFYQMFQVKEADTTNKKIYEVGNGQWNIPKLRELLEVIVPQNESFINFEVTNDFVGVGKKTMLLNAQKLYRPGNHTNMLLLAIEDITERKASEDMKDSFISIASHELKTPISTIKAFAQALQSNMQDNNKDSNFQSLQYPVNRISELTDKLHRLLDTLLDESMLQSGKLSLNKELFSLTEILINTINDFQIISPKHCIRLQADKDYMVFADKIRIKQVINNLLSNAVKYSPQAENVDVTISADNWQHELSVSIRDYGIGISNDDKKRLFSKFVRSRRVLDKNIPGIGLGLHISSEIMRMHNGNISVWSEENEGSSFTFTLPLP